MDIYLISLPKDLSRRETLQKQFPNFYSKFILIDAIDGKTLSAIDYFNLTIGTLPSLGRILSPSELGCSLSHMQALEQFIASDEEKALIIEDDIIGNDADIETIIQIASCLDENSLLICGGQEGLHWPQQFLYGKPSIEEKTFVLSKFSYPYVWRTSCYVVTQTSAKIILNNQKNNISIADNWNHFFKETNIVLHLSNILSHPADLHNSHIESERQQIASTKQSRITSFLKRWERRINKFICVLQGNKKIFVEEQLEQ